MRFHILKCLGWGYASIFGELPRLSEHNIGKILWDGANHMYVLGSDLSGVTKLWIYTVTPTSTTLAPGSPYWLSDASDIYIQTL